MKTTTAELIYLDWSEHSPLYDLWRTRRCTLVSSHCGIVPSVSWREHCSDHGVWSVCAFDCQIAEGKWDDIFMVV